MWCMRVRSLNARQMAMYVFFTTQDGGVAVGLFAPASAALPNGGTIVLDTAYPFDDVVTVTVTTTQAMPLYLRVPVWASSATLSVNGKPQVCCALSSQVRLARPRWHSGVFFCNQRRRHPMQCGPPVCACPCVPWCTTCAPRPPTMAP